MAQSARYYDLLIQWSCSCCTLNPVVDSCPGQASTEQRKRHHLRSGLLVLHSEPARLSEGYQMRQAASHAGGLSRSCLPYQDNHWRGADHRHNDAHHWRHQRHTGSSSGLDSASKVLITCLSVCLLHSINMNMKVRLMQMPLQWRLVVLIRPWLHVGASQQKVCSKQ